VPTDLSKRCKEATSASPMKRKKTAASIPTWTPSTVGSTIVSTAGCGFVVWVLVAVYLSVTWEAG
jgi:hypothetical protein